MTQKQRRGCEKGKVDHIDTITLMRRKKAKRKKEFKYEIPLSFVAVHFILRICDMCFTTLSGFVKEEVNDIIL